MTLVDALTAAEEVAVAEGGNLAVWLGFVAAMFTAGVTVIVAALNRGKRELRGDHANVHLMLEEIKDNQRDFMEDIREVKRSISRVHERIDTHLEHHNEHQEDFRRTPRPRLPERQSLARDAVSD